MLLKKLKEISFKKIIGITAFTIPIIIFTFFTLDGVTKAHIVNKNLFAYGVKIRNSVEEVDRILERAESNVNMMSDSIASSYEVSKQNDRNYNFNYIKQTDGLMQSALANSPGIDGAWFLLNSDLPFSASAYNWYAFKDNQFINLRDQFEGNSSTSGRKITPEDDPYYFGALGKRDVTWSDLYTDPDTKDQMVTLSKPIYKEGALVGVVGIDISINNIRQALQKIQFILSDSEIYLLNDKNKLIVSLDLNNEPIEISKQLSAKIIKIKEDGLVEYNTNKTGSILTLSNKYRILIGIDSKILYGNVDQLIATICILLILLILCIIIIIIPVKTEQTELMQETEETEEATS